MGKYCALTADSLRPWDRFAAEKHKTQNERTAYKEENSHEESNCYHGSIERFWSIGGSCAGHGWARRIREYA
jgi:hypothetical protein